MRLSNFRCDIPEIESANYVITKFILNDKDARRFNLRALISFSGGGRTIKPGRYTCLKRKGSHYPLMSDTPTEIGDHTDFITRAEGKILIVGLGLGFVLDACLYKTNRQPLPRHYLSPRDKKNIKRRKPIPTVDHAFVIEIEQEIIDLVAPYYLQKYPGRITIICADALEYKFPNGQHFNAVWHDIWPNVCVDNLPNMKKLHRKYGKRTEWQGSWCRRECERLAKT